MKLIWNCTAKTEAERLIWTAHQIQNGFYYSKNWLLLPYLAKGQSRAVYFPRYKYHKIEGFWSKVAKLEQRLLVNHPKFTDMVAQLFDEKMIEYQNFKQDWERFHAEFVRELDVIMPDILKGVESIEIRPTAIGVCSTSFSRLVNTPQPNRHIVVYIRHDMDYSKIAEGILLDRMNKDNTYSVYTWEEKEAIMDFLIQNTRLSKLFPNYTGTIKSLRQNQQAQLATDSRKYYKEFGFVGSLFECKNDEIYLRNKVVLLSPIEKKVMEKLILHTGHVVTFDSLSRVMWGKRAEDKYSLYAISKLVERLRKKIEKHGVFKDVIQTKRGEGYLLLR